MRATPPPSIICYKHHHHTKKYKVGRHLGVGGFAKLRSQPFQYIHTTTVIIYSVYRVQSLDSNKIYACKIINKSMLTRKEHQIKLVSEIKLHQSLQHPNIVRFERYFDDDHNVYILLEICTNQSLMELIRKRRKLTECEVRYFMNQIITAIQFLHSNKVIHRDLKLGNLLLDRSMNIKLCDFGLAARLEFDGARKSTICGTPNYIAPEILNQKKLGGGHSYEVDIWSLGVIMFTLLSGKPPFETRNIQETYRRIKRISYKWPSHTNDISFNAKDLVSRILTVDPSKRPNLMQIIRHPFFTKMNVLKVIPAFILMRKPMKNELIECCAENKDDCKTNDQCRHSNRQLLQNAFRQKNTGSQQPMVKQKEIFMDHPPKKPSPVVQHKFVPLPVPKAFDQDCKERNHFNPTVQIKQKQETKAVTQPQFENQQIPKIQYNQNILKEVDKLDGNNALPLIENLKISNVQQPKQNNVIAEACVHEQREKIEDRAPPIKRKEEFIFVVKHCDYSKKYGIGYILSNGFTGIYFNDSTKMNLHRDKHSITYLDENDNAQFCSYRNFPAALSKKVKLMQYFDAYLWKMDCDNNEIDRIKEKLRQKERVSDLVINENRICVKKWLQEKYAMLFRLSNNTVQVSFTDSSKLVFQDSSLIMYQNKHGHKSIYTLDQVYESKQKDLKKRFKYTQQLLVKLQSKKKG